MVNCGCCDRGGKKKESFSYPNDSELIEGFNFQNPEALEEFERSRV